MKIIKKNVVSALFCCCIFLSVASCKNENIEKSNSSEKDESQITIKKLVVLGEKLNPNDEEMKEFEMKYRSLTFNELIQFRKVQHEEIKLTKGIESDVVEKLDKDMEWFIKVNKQSISLFGKPLNQISDQQTNEVFSIIEKEKNRGKQSKVASCPEVGFNTSFSKGVGGSTNLNILSATEVRQPNSNIFGFIPDCDCQVTFGTSNTNFRKIRPLTNIAISLLSDFNNTLGGRQLTGASAGSYPVFGKLRVIARYPAATTSTGCNVLLGRYTLSNN